MRRFAAAALFLALVLPAARGDDKDDAVKKLDGTYQVVSVLVGGKADDSKKDEVKSFVIKDGSITIKLDKRDEVANFTLDSSKKPAHLNLTPKDGKETLKGIYETKETDKGLELTIAFPHNENAERPKDFKGEDKDVVVVKLLRKK